MLGNVNPVENIPPRTGACGRRGSVSSSNNRGRGPYVFKVSAQVYHLIGSMCPPVGEAPKFLQLYIYDMDKEVENKMAHFEGLNNSSLEPEIIQGLIHFLDAYNELVHLFRTAKDKCREIDIQEFKIRLYNGAGTQGYELLASNTLGAIVFDSGHAGSKDFDVIIQERDGPAQRISKVHLSYMSLRFSLLFIYGQSEFYTELKLMSVDGSRTVKRVTMLTYYAYLLHSRPSQYTLIFRGGRLFQQYIVGVFCCIEQDRLDFLRKKHNDI
nr:helitron helicase-like domain-containing protein [Tanacetum cinerariifolium]